MTRLYQPVLTDASLEERQATALETLPTCKHIKVLNEALLREERMVHRQVREDPKDTGELLNAY